MKRKLVKFIMFILFANVSINLVGQIDEIKNASRENASNSSSSSDSSDDCFSSDDDYSYGGGRRGAPTYDGPVLSLDIKALFDVGIHKGVDRNYTYVDYLPGFKVNVFNVFVSDFRFNILTEYTDGNPNSFKSWELATGINPFNYLKFSVFFGFYYYEEIWDEEPRGFWGPYIATKFPLNKYEDYIDFDLRFSTDDETKVNPFFETGFRFNKRFMDFEYFSGYITLGATYQNYYEIHDIWAIRGGVIINVHSP